MRNKVAKQIRRLTETEMHDAGPVKKDGKISIMLTGRRNRKAYKARKAHYSALNSKNRSAFNYLAKLQSA